MCQYVLVGSGLAVKLRRAVRKDARLRRDSIVSCLHRVVGSSRQPKEHSWHRSGLTLDLAAVGQQ